MCKFDLKNGDKRIDPCMRQLIKVMNIRWHTIACCCGHGKYPMTIVIKTPVGSKIFIRELLSDTLIPRKRNLYRRDRQGVYYLPEVSGRKA